MQNNRINESAKTIMCYLMLFIMLLTVSLFVRFAYIAIGKHVDGHNLLDFAEEKHKIKVKLKSSRGNIYDIHGNILALDLDAYSLYAILDEEYPNHVEDIEYTAEKLSEITGCMKEDYLEHLNKENVFQVEFGICGKINSIQKHDLELLELPGVDYYVGKKRYYPNEKFLAHTLGYVSINDLDVMNGFLGIEQEFNEILTGEDGFEIFHTDALGYKLKGTDMINKPAYDGQDIYLTIDSTMQMILEDVVNEVDFEYEPDEMVAVIADAKTGAIYAIVNRPTYNPNIKDIEYFYNNAVSVSYEPGSIIKPYVYATAIDQGVYQGSNTFMSGEVYIGDVKITDYNNEGWGRITYDEGLYHSSNVGIVKLLTDVIDNPSIYLNYLNRFGFGNKTGIKLPNEDAGSKLDNLDYFTKITAGFGQGIMTTPLQHIQAFSTFVNNGEMIKPQIISKRVDPNKNEIVFEMNREVVGMPISSASAKQVKQLLIEAVNNEVAVAKNFKLDEWTVMGKTGTAQIAGENGYIEGQYYHSFIGAAPAEDPKLIIYVGVKYPKKAGVYSSKIFKTVMRDSLIYLGEKSNIDYKDNSDIYIMEDFKNDNFNYVNAYLSTLGIEVIKLGDGPTIIDQMPKKNYTLVKGDRVILKTSDEVKMPNIINWPMSDVIMLDSLLEIEVIINGKGYVHRYNLITGEYITSEDKLEIELKP